MSKHRYICHITLIPFVISLLSGCGIALAPLYAIAPKSYYVVQPGNTPNDPQINGAVFTESVVRIFCIGRPFYGTDFLHKSGTVITAGHIVAGCDAAKVQVSLPDGTETGITKWQESDTVDLAVLYPQVSMNGRSVINLSQSDDVNIGEQVDFGSLPAGTENLSAPILTVGYLGGVDPHPLFEGGQVTAPLWVINANVNLEVLEHLLFA